MKPNPLMGQIAGDTYFEPQPFEEGGKLYEKLGIKVFHRFFQFLRQFFSEGENAKGYFLWDTSDLGLKEFIHASQINESAHTTFFMALNAFIAMEALRGEELFAFALALLNVGVNAYPIMLQRYIRPKIAAVLRRKEKRLPN